MKMKKDLNKQKSFPGYYIAKPIKAMLDKAKYEVNNKDWDRVYLIDGDEGSGKSLLALQLGYYLDPSLNISRIAFNGEELTRAIEKSEKGNCIIFDEAFNGLGSSGANTKLNRLIVRKLMECRQKNLFIIIVLPTIFLLQKYAALFRSRCLFHVYYLKDGTRGYYRIYNKKNKKLLYLLGHKLYSYNKPFINRSYRFCGKYPIDEISYREKKSESSKEVEEEMINKFARRFAILSKYVKEKLKVKYSDQLRLLLEYDENLDHAQLSRMISDI